LREFRLIRARDEWLIVRTDEHGRIAIAYRHEDRKLIGKVYKLVDEAYERGLVLTDFPKKPAIYSLDRRAGKIVYRDGVPILTLPYHQEAARVVRACRYALTIAVLSVREHTKRFGID